MYSKESGNILFLILIAVALFAALSYAVTSSTRSGSGSTERENERLNSSSMANYVVGLKSSVTRLIAHGCQTSELSFERTPFDGSDTDYVNPSSPVDFSCHVFHPNGGGYFWRDAHDILDTTSDTLIVGRINGGNAVQDIGRSCTGETCKELIYLAVLDQTFNQSQAICIALNEYFDINNPGGNPPVDSNITTGHFFDGTFATGNQGIGDVGEVPELHGQHSGCLQEGGGANNYHFYHVLLAR